MFWMEKGTYHSAHDMTEAQTYHNPIGNNDTHDMRGHDHGIHAAQATAVVPPSIRESSESSRITEQMQVRLASSDLNPQASSSQKREQTGRVQIRTSGTTLEAHDEDDSAEEQPGPSNALRRSLDEEETGHHSSSANTLHELEAERAKIRDLKAEVAEFKQQTSLPTSSVASAKSSKIKRRICDKGDCKETKQEMMALQAQVLGFRELLDALTLTRPAMIAASNTTAKHNPHALPLHALRFLELMPWHPKAKEASVVIDEIFEWQVYTGQHWRSELAYFPTFFKALPLGRPRWCASEPAKSSYDTRQSTFHLLPVLSVDQSTHAPVWTNRKITHRFDLNEDYALPRSPSAPRWKWIGGWTREQRNETDDAATGFCDSEGWSYAKQAGYFLESAATKLLDPATISEELSRLSNVTKLSFPHSSSRNPPAIIRRRQWSRKRVLVDYPCASEPTVHYLQIMAETEEIKLFTSKLQKQINETQQSLEQCEINYANDRGLWNRQRHELVVKNVELDREIQQLRAALRRCKGPETVLPPPKYVKAVFYKDDTSIDGSMDDADLATAAMSHSVTLDELSQPHVVADTSSLSQLLLHPEDCLVSTRETTSDRKLAPATEAYPKDILPFFHWKTTSKQLGSSRNDTSCIPILGSTISTPSFQTGEDKELASLIPEVEPCSDDNCSCLTSDDDTTTTRLSSSRNVAAEASANTNSEPTSRSFLRIFFNSQNAKKSVQPASGLK